MNVHLLFNLLLLHFLVLSAADGQITSKPGRVFTYDVDATQPQTETLEVTLTTDGFDTDEVVFTIPAWAPGAYEYLNYGKWIDTLQAWNMNDQPISVTRLDENRWQISSGKHLAGIRYVVEDMEYLDLGLLWMSTSEFDTAKVYFNGTAVFGFFEGYEHHLFNVRYRTPPGWRVFTALPVRTANGTDEYFARNYDELADAPVIIGGEKLDSYSFVHDSTQYDVVVNTFGRFRPDTLLALTREIVEEQTEFFGEIPFDRYLFIFRFVPVSLLDAGFGALEHANSSVYYLPFENPDGFRFSLVPEVVSHEIFHLWNPKRFFPKQFEPFNYNEKVRTTSIWFIEGITEYYAQVFLIRGNVLPEQHFYSYLKQNLMMMRLLPDLNAKSLTDLSLQIADLDGEEIQPFYIRGPIVGMMLDIELRERTENKKSLDDVVLYLNKHYAHAKKPYHDSDWIDIIRNATGVDVAGFYEKYISGTKPLPVQSYLAKAGIEFTEELKPDLGWNLNVNDNGALFVQNVFNEGTAKKMGLIEGDILTAIDGKPVPEKLSELQGLIGQMRKSTQVGDTLAIEALRNGAPLSLQGVVVAQPSSKTIVRPKADATPKQRAIRSGIFGIRE